jgi:hypothetical protein
MAIKYLTHDDAPEALIDVDGVALARLGVESSGQYLIRPDGHIAFRCLGSDLSGATEYLNRWFDVRFRP